MANIIIEIGMRIVVIIITLGVFAFIAITFAKITSPIWKTLWELYKKLKGARKK